ncbi:MAG TPA: erythromycin esterase family protein [Chitinophagaceae bacterium]|nr:erythromycin esterase family protein [Chitinophagaceae bacterium]
MKYTIIGVFLLILISSNVPGQGLTKDQNNFLQKSSNVVCNDDLLQPNWDLLSTKLKNKRVILLGEFTHGSKEIFELRNSLIRYLHQKAGIKVILFESGIGELISIDINKNTMTPGQMVNGLFGGWRTKEFVELMDYVKSENISIAGFDVQRTGGSFISLLKEIAYKKKIDSIYYYNLESRYGLLTRELTNNKAVYDSVKANTQNLIFDYQALQDKLSQYNSDDNSRDLLFSIATIKNRIKFLSYMLTFVKDKNWNTRWAARDSAMANNIHWLLENIYKNESVIVIGHNFHIARFSEKESSMGEILSPKYGKEMYSLGVFAGSGSYHDNSGKEIQILPPDSVDLDIKHIIDNLKGTVNFVDIPKNKLKGREWLDNKIIVNDTFIDLSNSNRMILSKSFDGLLLIKKVSPPKNH